MDVFWQGFTTFTDINYSEWIRRLRREDYPEIFDLEKAQQHHEYHQEGNALIHTLMVVDEMGKILDKNKIYGSQRIILLLASVCHDFGKVPSTFFNEKKGKWVAYGHEMTGVPIAAKFLEKIGIRVDSLEYGAILKLVRWHMTHTQSCSPKLVKKIWEDIKPSNVYDLILLMVADCRGKIPRKELTKDVIEKLTHEHSQASPAV